MDVAFVMFKADGARRDIPIAKRRVVVGRNNTCDIRMPIPAVSREHCEITVEGNTVKLRDLGSSNGTYHNNLRIQEVTLAAGDEVSVGPVTFTVVINGEPAKIEPVATTVPGEAVSGENMKVVDDTTTTTTSTKVVRKEPSTQVDKKPVAAAGGAALAAAAAAVSAAKPAKAAPATGKKPPVDDDDDVVPMLAGADQVDDLDFDMPISPDDSGDKPRRKAKDEDLDDPLAALEAMANTEKEDSGELPMLAADDDD